MKSKLIEIYNELLSFDVPLIALANDKNGNKLLCTAVFDKKYSNPYLCVYIDSKTEDQILASQVDIKTSLMKPHKSEWYIADFSKQTGVMTRIATKIWEVPRHYLPDDGLFVNESCTPNAALANSKIAIDGNWAPLDFSAITKIYNQIYALSYSFKESNCVSLLEESNNRPHRDGFSSMHLFSRLFSEIPISFRPRIKSIQYASPGHIELAGHKDANEYFLQILNIIKDDYVDLKMNYEETHSSLVEKKLLGREAKEYVSNDDEDKLLDSHFDALTKVLRLGTEFTKPMANANKLGRVKLLLILVRRIDQMSELVFSGKISL